MKILHSNLIGNSEKDLFIIHGFLGMGDNWRTHAKKISESNHKVHLIDLRNHGKSFWSNQLSFDEMAKDILNYAEFHNIKKFSLLGHSMGGNVSMLFAQKYSELIEKLIVVDIIPKHYKPQHKKILDSLKTIDFDISKSRKEVQTHMLNYVQDEKIIQFLLKNLYWVENNKLGLRLNIDILSKFQDKLSLKLDSNINYNKPVLFLYGESSQYVDKSDLPLIKSYFPNIQIVRVPSSGHWVHADNPKFFLDKTINFLN